MITPSKINLFLAVTGKRPDGYHEVEILFYPVREPADELTLEETPGVPLSMTCGTSGVPVNEENLCLRAVRAYCSAANLPVPEIRLVLEKRIPVAAGMGGGSSDAAAALLLMQARFQALPAEHLPEIALTLGADVPYFLNPVPALAAGVGEKLTVVKGLPESLPVLIAAPDFPVSAAWSYRHLDHRKAESDRTTQEQLIQALRNKDFVHTAECLRNDLSHAVLAKFPILQMLAGAMKEHQAKRVLVSGSGPTLFAMFADFETRDEAAAELAREFPECRWFSIR